MEQPPGKTESTTFSEEIHYPHMLIGNSENTNVTILRMEEQYFSELSDSVENLMATGTPCICMDFRNIQYVNSIGLGNLHRAAQTLQQADVDLILFGVQPRVFKIFEILGMHLPCYGSEQEALAALG